jgi:hypothetical protein
VDTPPDHLRTANTLVTNSHSLATPVPVPSGRRLPVGTGIGLAVAAAAWLCQGTLAFEYTDGPRLAVLPVSVFAIFVAFASGTAALMVARAGLSLASLWLLTLVFLPFLPLPVPAALQAWAGPLRILIWCGIALLMLNEGVRRTPEARRTIDRVMPLARTRPRVTAGVLSAAVFATAYAFVAPAVPRGDEPHYLVITQSLLRDRDLRIENNHRRGDYQAYYPWPLAPHYLQRGRDGKIYSIHAPGLSALVAPAFAIGGYPATVVVLILIAACGGALVWHLGWLVARSVAAAWFGWASVVLAPTTIFHSFTVFPDGVGGVITLTGVWALLRAPDERKTGTTSVRPWLLHGAALALLPWLHTRFAILAGSLGALVLLRLSTTRNPAGKAVAFLSVPAVSALCWVGFFIAIYGTPDPSAPYGGSREFSLAFIPGGLTGLLFDQRFGLLTNAPVLATAVAGLGLMLLRPSSGVVQDASTTDVSIRRLAIELLFVSVPYMLTVANFAMWWGGWSAPARFAAAIVPLLAIPAAFAWNTMRTRASRYSASLALAITAFLSAVLIVPGRGALAFNTREGYAHSLNWLSRLADLGHGMPAWFRDRELEFFLDTVVWIAIGLAAWRLIRVFERSPRLRTTASFATVVSLSYASAFMLALTVTWSLHGVERVNAAPAQVEVLRRLSDEPRLLAWQLNPFSPITAERVPSLLRIDPGRRFVTDGGAGRNDRPLLTLPGVPAGSYGVRVRTSGPGGWLMVGIGQDQFALKTLAITSPPVPIEIDFPVDVRALIVRGDDDARRVVRELVIEPVSVVPARDRLTTALARQAVRYGSSSVYFLDDRSFPEPEAFWVGGARSTSVVFDPDTGSSIDLQIRNAPVENVVTMQSGTWREVLQLTPGEERQLRLPVDPQRGAALVTITTSSGFRPSEVESESRDSRFLGVWVKP